MNSYLLGKLTEEEAARFEAEVFDDDAGYELFQAAQDELLDAYARGALSPADRERFERHALASPFMRERTAFASALHETVRNSRREAVGERVSPESARTIGWLEKLKAMFSSRAVGLRALAAALLLLVAVGGSVYLWREVLRLRREAVQTQARLHEENRQSVQERRRADELAEQLRREQSRRAALESELAARPTPELPSTAAGILSFVLAPAGFRDGGGQQQLRLPPSIKTIQLHLRFSGATPKQSCRVEIETIDERTLWARGGLRAAGRQVTASVPASALPGGDYLVKLKTTTAEGVEQELAGYPLRVVKD